MKTDEILKPSKEGAEMLESLRKAVANALEKKKRLGQYAVVWGENGVEVIGNELSSDK